MSVNTVTKIVGIMPADEHYKKMLQVFDACKAAGIECPEGVNSFLHLDDHDDDYNPPRDGMEIDLEDIPGLIDKNGYEDECDGAFYNIDVSKIPDNVQKIMVHVYLDY